MEIRTLADLQKVLADEVARLATGPYPITPDQVRAKIRDANGGCHHAISDVSYASNHLFISFDEQWDGDQA